MSIFKKQAIIESFPACDIALRESTSDGFVQITADDILGLDSGRGFYRGYSAGSVVSYALQYNECPIAAVADAKERGHAMHWINARAACISSTPGDRYTMVKVWIGMNVCFEGLRATIEQDHNNNLKFVPV